MFCQIKFAHFRHDEINKLTREKKARTALGCFYVPWSPEQRCTAASWPSTAQLGIELGTTTDGDRRRKTERSSPNSGRLSSVLGSEQRGRLPR